MPKIETERNCEDCKVKFFAQYLAYCPKCLPVFMEKWERLKREDKKYYEEFRKKSLEKRKEWAHNLDDPNYRKNQTNPQPNPQPKKHKRALLAVKFPKK